MTKVKPAKPKKKVSLPPLWIVDDGALSNADISQGRTVPVLIVNSTSAPLIQEVIRSHRYLPPGDVSTDWGMGRDDPSLIVLMLHFRQPINTACMLAFQMPQHAALVDQVITARSLYLQIGKEGDRLSNTFDSPRLLVEVAPHPKFTARWEYEYPRIMARRLRKEEGLSHSEAERVAGQFIAEFRETLGYFRFPPTD